MSEKERAIETVMGKWVRETDSEKNYRDQQTVGKMREGVGKINERQTVGK